MAILLNEMNTIIIEFVSHAEFITKICKRL